MRLFLSGPHYVIFHAHLLMPSQASLGSTGADSHSCCLHPSLAQPVHCGPRVRFCSLVGPDIFQFFATEINHPVL